jgi:hypothetical protein
MARGGLAALANQYRKGGKIKYFEEGGEGPGTGNDAGVSDVGGNEGPGTGNDAGVSDVGGGGSDPGAAAQAAAQAVDNAVAAEQDAAQEAAAEATLGAQVAAEADEAEAENAANTAAALGAQANAIAAEAIANAEEDAKAAEMAAVMSGQVAGFPGPTTPGFGVSFQNPFSTDISKGFGLFSPFATVTTPFGQKGFSTMDFAAPAMGKAAQAVNTGVNVGRAMGFAEGGVASLANQIQSKGRGQDTMLVHMTPGEVKGLQALAMSQGGSLTINPQTGLPEAGFLSSILPMIAGFALGPAGFALMSAPMAGLTVGAMTGIATGSLKKGLMAGLGAYGGAGIGEGLVNAATPVEAAQTGIVADPSLIDASATQFPTKDITFGQTPNFGVPSAPNVMPPDVASGRFVDDAIAKAGYTYDSAGGPLIKMTPDVMPPDVASGRFVDEGIAKAGYTYDPAGKSLIKTPVTGPVPGESGLNFSSSKNRFFDQLPPSNLPVQPTGLQGAGSGLKNMFDTGQVGTDARSAFMKATPTGSLTAAGTTLASALTPEPAPLPTSKSFIRGYDLDITNPSGTPMYTPQDTREREQVRYTYSPREIYEAAQGGLTALNGQTYDDEYGRDEYDEGGSVQKRKSRSLKGNPYYRFADSRRDSSMEAAVEQNFAKGGLGAVLPPRFLSGGGDGMSDSIKARIGGVQEARLADGEFVVPADVVSHLGNGSSKAGAKKLYAMMDKIRKARTGRKSQAPEVNARKYMPA